MRVFMIALVAAILTAAIGALALEATQQSVTDAFATSSARV